MPSGNGDDKMLAQTSHVQTRHGLQCRRNFPCATASAYLTQPVFCLAGHMGFKQRVPVLKRRLADKWQLQLKTGPYMRLTSSLALPCAPNANAVHYMATVKYADLHSLPQRKQRVVPSVRQQAVSTIHSNQSTRT